jgi:aminopeptidase N
MTDKINALVYLCRTQSTEKEIALNEFFNRWKDDAVVFNKWLQVQALSPSENTFERVQQLSRLSPFSLENPNNIYSLHMVLGGNYLAMQQDDGKTFSWFCDELLKIDEKNPQAAARLCGSFNFLKKFPTTLKELGQIENLLGYNIQTLGNKREKNQDSSMSEK